RPERRRRNHRGDGGPRKPDQLLPDLPFAGGGGETAATGTPIGHRAARRRMERSAAASGGAGRRDPAFGGRPGSGRLHAYGSERPACAAGGTHGRIVSGGKES